MVTSVRSWCYACQILVLQNNNNNSVDDCDGREIHKPRFPYKPWKQRLPRSYNKVRTYNIIPSRRRFCHVLPFFKTVQREKIVLGLLYIVSCSRETCNFWHNIVDEKKTNFFWGGDSYRWYNDISCICDVERKTTVILILII